jgi:glycosyltransferase involved in cell wall biosynthesis
VAIFRYKLVNILILNKDLPVFPGWISVEYLHTINLARLARTVGVVSMVHTAEQSEKTRALSDAGVQLFLWCSPFIDNQTSSPARRYASLRTSLREFWHWSAAVFRRPQDTVFEDFSFRNLAPSVLSALAKDRWQTLIVVQSSAARWIDYLPLFSVSVLVMHDIRSLVYQRRAQTAPSALMRLWYRLESENYRRFERRYAEKYDLVITVSEDDAKWVRQNYRHRNTISIPLPLDHEYFAATSLSSDEKSGLAQRIMFTGTMDHPPNADAAAYFARNVLPRVRTAVPNAEFWIVGRNPGAKVQQLAQLPGVVVTGEIPDIRGYLATADVVVVPLRFGSGMRTKILEAWAMQKCVVSTSVGAEGLDYQDGENLVIADDAAAFAQRVIEVLQNDVLRERLRKRGREIVVQQHDPQKLANRYYGAIKNVFEQKRHGVIRGKTVIDLRWMIPGLAGGAENLSRSFLDELIQLDNVNEYTLLIPRQLQFEFDLRTHHNFRLMQVDSPQRKLQRVWRRSVRKLYQSAHLDYWRSFEVEQLQFVRDLHASTALSIPGYINPDLFVLKNVLVVLDLQHEYLPEFFTLQALEERRRVYGESIRHADYMLAISEHSRQSVIERYGIDPSLIETAYLAADPIFGPTTPRIHAIETIAHKYQLPVGEYLYFPAHTWRHKNHKCALEALALLRDQFGLRPLLVCSGGFREAQEEIEQIIERLNLWNQVKFLGYCPLDELPLIYEGAAALVYPSLFEGFGIPVIEAMMCDCPVVCSNTTSLPEIVGNAGLLVDPTSPEAIADAIYKVLTNSQLRQTLIDCGRIQANLFSWRKFTQQVTKALYRVQRI